MTRSPGGSPRHSPRVLDTAWLCWGGAGFAARYVGALCGHDSGATTDARSSLTLQVAPPPPTDGELAKLVLTAPLMPGAEYLTADVMLALWAELSATFAASLTASGTDLQVFLKSLNPAWNL